jgi:hypothetical protein
MANFWGSISEKLAERWAAVSVPALVFWMGGLLAWVISRGGFQALKLPADWLGKQSAPTQLACILLVLLAVAASGVVVARLTMPVLQLMEGYWPRFLDAVRRPLVNRARLRAESIDREFQSVAGPVLSGNPPPTPEQQASFNELSQRWRRYPGPGRYQSTRVGNTLRAGESRPADKYGLDAVALWPHLWLLLPDNTRTELTAARSSLDSATGAFIWGILFLVFTIWTPWAAVAGLVVAVMAYQFWVPNRAEVFADLLEAAFDLHRLALYRQLRWPLPENPQDERVKGRQLTRYLMRGESGTRPSFTSSDACLAESAGHSTDQALLEQER